jgi:hypothetical protein
MPEATEIPAPVRATTRSASTMRLLARLIWLGEGRLFTVRPGKVSRSSIKALKNTSLYF